MLAPQHDSLKRSRHQAEGVPNHYGIVDISGTGSTILGNVYNQYVGLPGRRHEDHYVNRSAYGRNAHWTITRSTNPYFTGRTDLINKIVDIAEDTLHHGMPTNQCRIVITGMGGQGKSEICLQVANRLRPSFWGVFRADVSTSSSAQSSFQVIGNTIRISDPSIDSVRQMLANTEHPWVLVLDNADDSEMDYSRYFPTGNLGVIIMTSRNSECSQYSLDNTVPLDGLPLQDARDLLLKTARISSTEHETCQIGAGNVTSFLLGHPLAIIQAGSYIQRGHCSLIEYPAVFHRQRRRLLTFRPVQAQPRYGDIYATFEASADAIKSMNTEAAKDALELLSVLAMLDSSSLSLSLFEKAWRGTRSDVYTDSFDSCADWRSAYSQIIPNLPRFLGANSPTWDFYRTLEAVRLLGSYSLLKVNTSKNTQISMHPLTHAWAKDRQDLVAQQHSWRLTGSMLHSACETCRYSESIWVEGAFAILPHLRAVLTSESQIWGEPTPLAVNILYQCGIQWMEQGLSESHETLQIRERLILWAKLGPRITDAQWLPLYYLIGCELIADNLAKEAVTILEDVVIMGKSQLPDKHPHRISWTYALAYAYVEDQKVAEARALFEEVLSGGKLIISAGFFILFIELLAESEENDTHQRLASILEKAVEEHYTLAQTRHRTDRRMLLWILSMIYRQSDQPHRAIAILEEIINTREQTAGEPDIMFASTQGELGSTYAYIGETPKAITWLEKAVAAGEHTIEASDHSLLNWQFTLAQSYTKAGQAQRAIPILEKVLRLRQQTSEDFSNDKVYESRLELEKAYREAGETTQAIQVLDDPAEVEERLLPGSISDVSSVDNRVLKRRTAREGYSAPWDPGLNT